MNSSIGWATLSVIPSFKGFQAELEKGTGKHMLAAGASGGTAFGDAAGKNASKRFGNLFKAGAKAAFLGAAGAGALAVKVGKDSIGHASDLSESLNAVNVTYSKQSKAVRKLGEEAADALGLSQTEFQGLSVQFSSFAKTIGKEGKGTVTTLDELTTRGADFASVMNLEVNQAMGLFQSGLAGETEPLRRFGLNLSAAAVESFAYAKGIAETGKELTEAEKIQARYGLLMRQTAKTHGDFANTSDSLANVQRRLNARWDDAQAKLGTALLPYMEDAAGFLLDRGIPAFEDFSEWFNAKGIPAIHDFGEEVRPLAREVLPAMGDALGTVRDVLKPAAGYAVDLVKAFNDMPGWAKTGALGGAAGLWGLTKLPKRSKGGLGGGVLSKASPVPVFVTNPGFDGPGADVPGKGNKLLGAAGKFAGPAAVIAAGVAAAKYSSEKFPERFAANAGTEGALGGIGRVADETKRLDKILGDNRESAKGLNTELSKRIKLNFDNRPILDAQAEMRRLIQLQQTANSINPRHGGADAVHRGKLYGDAYGSGVTVTGGMHFNGVDLQGAKREADHLRRTAALGGADFR
jgi:hypothetical protein